MATILFTFFLADTAVVDLTASENDIVVVVENQGTDTQTFDVSVSYKRITDPLIGTQTVTLASGAKTAVTFQWSPSWGSYQITAEAILNGDMDPTDNTYTITEYYSLIEYIRGKDPYNNGPPSTCAHINHIICR